MVSKFQEVDRAVAYLCGYVREHDPQCPLGVSYYPHGHHCKRCMVTDAEHLSAIVQRMCRDFQGAAVILDTTHETPTAMAIQGRTKGKHMHHDDRPIVTIMPCDNNVQPEATRQEHTLKMMQAMIQEASKEEKLRKSPKHNRLTGGIFFG